MRAVIGAAVVLLLLSCGGASDAPETSSTAAPDPPAAGQTERVRATADPCAVLTQEEIRRVFPENGAPIASEGAGCLYQTLRVDLRPLSLAAVEAEAAPTGWQPRSIEIDGADWAVVRIDTNETRQQKVLDVLAGGSGWTVHLIPWGKRDNVEFGSPEHDGLMELLRTAVARHGGEGGS